MPFGETRFQITYLRCSRVILKLEPMAWLKSFYLRKNSLYSSLTA